MNSPSFGQADPAALMTRDASNPNLYPITFTPRSYYPMPASETMLRLGMIFKDAAGTRGRPRCRRRRHFHRLYQGGPAVRITSAGATQPTRSSWRPTCPCP